MGENWTKEKYHYGRKINTTKDDLQEKTISIRKERKVSLIAGAVSNRERERLGEEERKIEER